MSKIEGAIKALLQAAALALGALVLGMVIHKGAIDISLIADRLSGSDFWRAVGQYVIGNLAGGGKPPEGKQ